MLGDGYRAKQPGQSAHNRPRSTYQYFKVAERSDFQHKLVYLAVFSLYIYSSLFWELTETSETYKPLFYWTCNFDLKASKSCYNNDIIAAQRVFALTTESGQRILH